MPSISKDPQYQQSVIAERDEVAAFIALTESRLNPLQSIKNTIGVIEPGSEDHQLLVQACCMEEAVENLEHYLETLNARIGAFAA